MKNKKLLIAAASLLLIVSAIVVMQRQGVIKLWGNRTSDNNDDFTDSNIDYSPPTEDEKSAGDRQKQKIDEENEKNNNNTEDTKVKKNVSVIITDASQYGNVIEVRSFIPDHYEDGTCTITFSKGGSKVTKTAAAFKDVSTTICTNPKINRSDFPASGEWQVAVEYESPGAEGVSESQNITIK